MCALRYESRQPALYMQIRTCTARCYIYTSISVPRSFLPGAYEPRYSQAIAPQTRVAAATATAQKRHGGTAVAHLSVWAHSLSGSLAAWQNVTSSPAAHKVRTPCSCSCSCSSACSCTCLPFPFHASLVAQRPVRSLDSTTLHFVPHPNATPFAHSSSSFSSLPRLICLHRRGQPQEQRRRQADQHRATPDVVIATPIPPSSLPCLRCARDSGPPTTTASGRPTLSGHHQFPLLTRPGRPAPTSESKNPEAAYAALHAALRLRLRPLPLLVGTCVLSRCSPISTVESVQPKEAHLAAACAARFYAAAAFIIISHLP